LLFPERSTPRLDPKQKREKQSVRSSWLFIPVFFVATCFPVQAQSERQSADKSELVHFGDLIDVDIVGSFEFDWRGTLNPEGFLDGLEHVDAPVYALCQSESAIARSIEKEYARMLRDPRIVVKIVDRSNRAVAYLDGAVKTPQRFQIRRPVNLNELIILSGGLTDNASGEISIFRPADVSCREPKPAGGEDIVKAAQNLGSQTLNIKIADLLRGVREANPQIVSGDIVTVAEALPIYVIGGVNVPKTLSSRAKMTVSHAVDSAGGLAKEAAPGKITIFRRDSGSASVLEVDLEAVRAGKAEDVILKPFDIVEVPQKGKPKRAFPPVIERTGTGRGPIGKLPLRIVD
jgi:protein involved in polysaccharide export with SLBB domain